MYWLSLLIFTIFCYWVIFRDGAELIEGWLAALVVDPFAGVLSAACLRAYVGVIWVIWLAVCARNWLSTGSA